MTCKDCISYDICAYNAYVQAEYSGRAVETYITIDNKLPCRFFKDKSRYIELPCKVGDTVYRLDDLVWKSDCDECEHFEEGWYDCPSECGRTNTATKFHECIEIKEEVITLQDILTYMKWNDFGKIVFLSREEAKKALAERSENK